MYYELGTMVCISKDALPFVNHEKGISIPNIDVVGEIVVIHPTILSYTVRLSKYFTLVFSEDDIYGLPGWMSGRHDLFHKMLGSVVANAHQFYYVKEFEDYVSRATEKRGIFNKIPKYNINDIVIVNKDFSFSFEQVVGVIKDVSNHRDTGEVIYHIIFNSSTPRKFFEYEIETKFNTDKFKDGQAIYKQLLIKMYHTNHYKYLSEKDAIAWMYANFEVYVEENIGSELNSLCTTYVNASKYSYRYDLKYLERSLKNLQQNSLYEMHPEYFPGYHFTPARRPLKALEELNRREFERIAVSPIKIEIDDEIKARYSVEEIKKMINNTFGVSKYEYKKIIFSGPCTIILWTDGSKTIAKTSSDEEVFDPEKGVAICFMKKMLGHTETNKIIRKASEQYKEYIAENRPNSSFDEFIEYLSSLKSKTKSVDQSTIDEVKKVEEEQDD